MIQIWQLQLLIVTFKGVIKVMRELACRDGRKSFYGKAHVIERNDGVYLRSYDTIVCRIVNGTFQRLWDGYSATTMRHVNSFLDEYGIPGGGKAWWDHQELYI